MTLLEVFALSRHRGLDSNKIFTYFFKPYFTFYLVESNTCASRQVPRTSACKNDVIKACSKDQLSVFRINFYHITEEQI